MSTRPAVRGITRREGLLAAMTAGSIGLLTACTGSAGTAPATVAASATSAKGPAADPASVATSETGLIALYDATLAALASAPADLRALLADIRDQHAAHLAAVGGTVDTSSASDLSVSSDTGTALGALVAAERRAGHERIRACEDAPTADLARTLAFIAASESSHVVALRRAVP